MNLLCSGYYGRFSTQLAAGQCGAEPDGQIAQAHAQYNISNPAQCAPSLTEAKVSHSKLENVV